MGTVTEDTDAPAIHLDYPLLIVQFRPLIFEVLDNPEKISGEPVLKGFTLNLNEIW